MEELLTKNTLTKPQTILKIEQPITKGYAIIESIINSCFFYFLLNNKKKMLVFKIKSVYQWLIIILGIKS